MLRDDKQTYQYDAFNRTTQVDTFDGNVQINRYDAENLRHEIVENGNLASFIFSHSEVVVETNTTDTIRLIRGYDIICSDSEKAKTYYHYASDELGSTTHIFEGNQLRNRYEYDAFGNITSQEETIHNRFKYTGQQHDPITQQYYLRARFYNPVIARFTQEDVYRGAGLNLYAYCDNNPVNYFDPSGYSPCPTKQDLYKRYRAEGYSAADANKMANTDLIRQKQGDAEADKYQAANPVGKDRQNHHTMNGQIIREGQIIYESDYISGGGRGGYREGLLVHTERKFLNDAEFIVIDNDHLQMEGSLNPCKPGCQPAIRKFVQDNNVTATYVATETGHTYTWSKFSDPKLKGTVLQQITDSQGNIVGSWRYWQNSGRWKRAKY